MRGSRLFNKKVTRLLPVKAFSPFKWRWTVSLYCGEALETGFAPDVEAAKLKARKAERKWKKKLTVGKNRDVMIGEGNGETLKAFNPLGASMEFAAWE